MVLRGDESGMVVSRSWEEHRDSKNGERLITVYILS
jgi:hypothetical protein